MKHIVYLSTSNGLMTENQLVEILRQARAYNTEHQITGLLLYSEGTFIQLIEGSAKDVDTIFSKIRYDNRHKGLIKLIDKPLAERDFPEWSMGFAAVNQDEAEEIIGYFQSFDKLLSSENKNSAVSLLKSFIKTNKLAVNN